MCSLFAVKEVTLQGTKKAHITWLNVFSNY